MADAASARATAELEAFLAKQPGRADLAEHLNALKLHVMNEGVPANADGSSKLRPLIWCILLGIEPIAVDDYLALLERGASPAYQKIRNDTFRTLANDTLFKSRVSEPALIRLLNSYSWHATDLCKAGDARDAIRDVAYVQGMNILAAPFLYVAASEVQAFAMYKCWVDACMPTYTRPDLAGVHMGVKLLDRCLEQLDAKLYRHLRLKGLTAEVYAFPCKHVLMTSSALCH